MNDEMKITLNEDYDFEGLPAGTTVLVPSNLPAGVCKKADSAQVIDPESASDRSFCLEGTDSPQPKIYEYQQELVDALRSERNKRIYLNMPIQWAATVTQCIGQLNPEQQVQLVRVGRRCKIGLMLKCTLAF